MKLLVFTKYYWPEGGGAELATHLILNMLSKEFDITVVSGTAWPKLPCSLSKYVHLGAFKHKYKPLELLNLSLLNSTISSLIKETDAVYICSHLPLTILAKKIRPDTKVIVHLHNYQPMSYTSIVYHDERNGSDFSRSIRFELLENKSACKAFLSGALSSANIVNRVALSYADEIICVSHRQAEILTKNLRTVRGKVRVIYNPLPSYREIQKIPSERPTMLYLGGDSHGKGFCTLLSASQKVLAGHKNVRFVFAERFSRSGKILIDKLNMRFDEAYSLLGHVDHDEIPRLHSISSALLFPSVWEEPLPYAIIEAMLLGTIVVASKVGGVLEIVQNTSAEKMLFNAGDSDELAEKIKEVSSFSKEELVDVGSKLKEGIARKFNNKSTEARLLKVFDSR